MGRPAPGRRLPEAGSVVADPSGTWRVAITVNGVELCLGYFGRHDDAEAVLAVARELFERRPRSGSRQNLAPLRHIKNVCG